MEYFMNAVLWMFLVFGISAFEEDPKVWLFGAIF